MPINNLPSSNNAAVMAAPSQTSGDDPENYNRERDKVEPVEKVIRFIAQRLQTRS
jgi:hypothetical protein